ncbi:hypothetical protein HDV00_009403 [Rhizophlyctis rosea]|nr:hypothetical protein HDV00_009403 [Rhizophlyctis rosea]
MSSVAGGNLNLPPSVSLPILIVFATVFAGVGVALLVLHIKYRRKLKNPNYLPTYIEAQYFHNELRRRAGTLTLPPSYEIVEVGYVDEHVPKWMLVDVPYQSRDRPRSYHTTADEEERARVNEEEGGDEFNGDEEPLIEMGGRLFRVMPRGEGGLSSGRRSLSVLGRPRGLSGSSRLSRGRTMSTSSRPWNFVGRTRAHTVAMVEGVAKGRFGSRSRSTSRTPPPDGGVEHVEVQSDRSVSAVALESIASSSSSPPPPPPPQSPPPEERDSTLLRSVLQPLKQDPTLPRTSSPPRDRSPSDILRRTRIHPSGSLSLPSSPLLSSPLSSPSPLSSSLPLSPLSHPLSQSPSPQLSSPLRPQGNVHFQLPKSPQPACVNEARGAQVLPMTERTGRRRGMTG